MRLAERRLRLTIDVINFFAELTQDRTRIFLPGDAGPSARYALRIASDGSTPDLAQTRLALPLAEYRICLTNARALPLLAKELC